ncbi:MAG: PhzF family phenazine biosynthesis protein, partial [Firmicutes bacterium]|nr:PhzF family phenazine biosynthesis protein [Bacillota bacterium]
MRFFIADAFTETLFGGNPAGVVLIDEDRDYPSDEVMVKTAAELRYSETAFIKKLAPGEFRARYFTPAAEVDLCGHATIASFYCLLRAGIISEGETCLVHTLSGDIEVSVTNGFVMMDMASPKHLGTIKDAVELDRLYEVMGSEYNQKTGLYPMMISTGLPDIMMPVASREELEELAPDMK